jgi:hypothetical protein
MEVRRQDVARPRVLSTAVLENSSPINDHIYRLADVHKAQTRAHDILSDFLQNDLAAILFTNAQSQE